MFNFTSAMFLINFFFLEQKFKDFSTLISFKVKVNSGIPEEWGIHAPLMAPVVLHI
jgi:hypothetical protein